MNQCRIRPLISNCMRPAGKLLLTFALLVVVNSLCNEHSLNLRYLINHTKFTSDAYYSANTPKILTQQTDIHSKSQYAAPARDVTEPATIHF